MTDEAKKQAKKLLLLKDEPTLAVFDELQEIKTLLEILTGKEKLEIHANADFPDIPPFPEMPKTDLTQTNELLMTTVAGLAKILEALQKVEVTLEITDED